MNTSILIGSVICKAMYFFPLSPRRLYLLSATQADVGMFWLRGLQGTSLACCQMVFVGL